MDIQHSKAFIRNCDFRFQCHQTWEGLSKLDGDEDSVRHCGECKKNVYLVESSFDLVLAMEQNLCVAVPRTMVIDAKAIKNKNKHSIGSVAPIKDSE